MLVYHLTQLSIDPATSNVYRMVGVSNGGGNGSTKNGKSYRFAGKLSGRFFVSGISGGFEKHKQQQQLQLKQEPQAATKVPDIFLWPRFPSRYQYRILDIFKFYLEYRSICSGAVFGAETARRVTERSTTSS